MERQIPSLLELVFRIKLVKITKGGGLLSLLEMLLETFQWAVIGLSPVQAANVDGY